MLQTRHIFGAIWSSCSSARNDVYLFDQATAGAHSNLWIATSALTKHGACTTLHSSAVCRRQKPRVEIDALVAPVCSLMCCIVGNRLFMASGLINAAEFEKKKIFSVETLMALNQGRGEEMQLFNRPNFVIICVISFHPCSVIPLLSCHLILRWSLTMKPLSSRITRFH